MHDAIKNSCDTYFYQTALRIGPDPIAQAAEAMGFGQTFDIGIPGQKKGVVGSREWKRKRRSPSAIRSLAPRRDGQLWHRPGLY
jgi:cell division protein FtsI/penicillin-binding protein 2